MATSTRDVGGGTPPELRDAILAAREAREILSLFERIGMDDASKLKAYTKRLEKQEQAERRIRKALLGGTA